MKHLNDMTDADKKTMTHAIAAYGAHSEHIPSNTDYDRCLERFVAALLHSLGYEQPENGFRHIHVTANEGQA